MTRNMRNTALILLILAAPVLSQGVVVNECFTGVPDWCEVINLSGSAVNIGGWTLHMTDDPTTVTSFTFPAGTTLQPNEIAVVTESTTAPTVPAGTQVFVTGNINWAGPTSPNDPDGGAGLNDGAGAGQDLVLFGAPTNIPVQTPASPFSGSLGHGDVIERVSLVDTDNASDWASTTGGTGTPGALNPGQLSLPPVASFTANPTTIGVGGLVGFTDTSMNVPTSWMWDLDGDAIIDSTAQNPTFSYASTGSYDVTLTVSNAFGADSVTMTGLITVVASTAVTAPYTQDFDSGPLLGEWLLNSEPNGQITFGNDGDVSPLSGGDGMIMDCVASGAEATNTATLTVDLAATGGGILRYYFKETADEDHPEDGVFLSDGVNTVQIQSHNGASGSWTEFVIDLTQAAINNGIALTSSNEITFSQRDNFPTPTDGGYFDDIRVFPPPVPDTGQANSALAHLDVNGGLNLNGNAAFNGENGPFFANGNTMNITVSGEPNQPYLLLFSVTLMRNNATFPFGQLDVGGMGPGNFSDIVIVLDGANGSGFFDTLAKTNGGGTSSLGFGLATEPLGLLGTLQAVVFNSTPSVVGMTAAFEFTVTP